MQPGRRLNADDLHGNFHQMSPSFLSAGEHGDSRTDRKQIDYFLEPEQLPSMMARAQRNGAGDEDSAPYV
jgi:hypothetical protein